jgi:phosphopantetheine adenylyltransferase
MSPLLEAILKQVQQLSNDERLELIQQVAEQMKSGATEPKRKHKISEFRGIAPNLLESRDAQDWVNGLRSEWDDRTK